MSTKIESAIQHRFSEAQDRLVLQSADLSLESLSNMVGSSAIDITPKYQRRERWSSDKQSALIESFLLNIPIPPIYLSEEKFGVYSVIDGKQRLTAIHRFMTNELPLGRLETFHEVEGLYFDELPDDLKNALRVRPYLRVVTLLKQSDPGLKYEVFTRLNRGGEPLNAQEIRNVVFRGKLNDKIVELSTNDFLRQQLKIRSEKSKAYQKMKDLELVLRFVTLADAWKNFGGDYRRSMDEFMFRHTPSTEDEIEFIANRFNRSIRACERIWGDVAFKRASAAGGWRDQLLAGMYDAQMIAINELSDNYVREAVENRDAVVEATRAAFEDERFDSSVRVATNNAANILYRVEKMTDIVAGEY